MGRLIIAATYSIDATMVPREQRDHKENSTENCCFTVTCIRDRPTILISALDSSPLPSYCDHCGLCDCFVAQSYQHRYGKCHRVIRLLGEEMPFLVTVLGDTQYG